MKAWRESEPATADSEIAPLSLRHILGAPPVDTWWSQRRNLLWSISGWVTSAAVVVSAGYLLWAMMYRHASDTDPFLGPHRPRATSTLAPPPDDRRTEVAEVLKVVRPEPLPVATTASSVPARDSTVTVNGGADGDGGGRNRDQDGGSPESSSSTAPGGTPGSTATSVISTTWRTATSTSTSSTFDDKGGGSGSGSGGA